MRHRTAVFSAAAAAAVFSLNLANATAAITADAVTGYSAGTPVQTFYTPVDASAPTSYTVPTAALGLPDLRQNVPVTSDGTGGTYSADNSVITPFNAQYNAANVVALSGAGGSLTLHLSAPVPAGAADGLVVHSAAGLADGSAPNYNGGNYPAARNYTDPRQADISVSADNATWFDLGDRSFNIPTNVYADVSGPYTSAAGTQLADFGKPFAGSLASFNGETFAQTLATLDGSAGGTFVSLSGLSGLSGLSQVNYVRFTTAGGETMYVDAVAGVVPEPGSTAAVAAGAALVLLGRRRRSAPGA